MATEYDNISNYLSTEPTLAPSLTKSLPSTYKCSSTTCNENLFQDVLNVLNIIVTLMYMDIYTQ